MGWRNKSLLYNNGYWYRNNNNDDSGSRRTLLSSITATQFAIEITLEDLGFNETGNVTAAWAFANEVMTDLRAEGDDADVPDLPDLPDDADIDYEDYDY